MQWPGLITSLLTQESGLKSILTVLCIALYQSLLTQESGLKCLYCSHLHSPFPVSPYTGEWIEILSQMADGVVGDVSPYTGEWIEIGRSNIEESEGN